MGLWDPLIEGFDLIKEVLKENSADQLTNNEGEEEHFRERGKHVQRAYNGRKDGEHKE